MGTFCAEVENVCLKKLTLIRKPNGELRVFGSDLEVFMNQLAQAALAEAEVQHD